MRRCATGRKAVIGSLLALCLGGCMSASETGSASAGVNSKARIEDTQWNLTHLGTRPVVVASGQRVPGLTLESQQKRVAAFGGCNGMGGTYTLEGNAITFSQMMGTMMACEHGMEQESAFGKALSATAKWQVTDSALEFLDSSGQVLARFDQPT